MVDRLSQSEQVIAQDSNSRIREDAAFEQSGQYIGFTAPGGKDSTYLDRDYQGAEWLKSMGGEQPTAGLGDVITKLLQSLVTQRNDSLYAEGAPVGEEADHVRASMVKLQETQKNIEGI